MTRFKPSIALTALLIIVFVASACAGVATPAAPTPDVGVPQTQVVGDTPTEPSGPRHGGTFRMAISVDFTDFDPGRTTWVDFQTMKNGGLWNSLLTWDRDLNMQPELAESWEVTDFQTYVFHLRQGVKFHTGREMTAHDVKWTFEHMIKEGKVYARELARVVGAAEAAADKTLDVTGIQVLDDYTIQVELTDSFVPWLNSVYAIPILDKDTIDTISQHPIGTGPFKFVEWIPNDRIVLERFDEYWVEGQPYLDRVELRVIPNLATAVANLQAGEIDAILIMEASQVSAFEGNPNFVIHDAPSTDMVTIVQVIDHNPQLQDVHARRALAHCLDKDTINRTVYFGYGEPLWSPIPPAIANHDPAVEELGYEYSVELARAELAQSATPNGFDITYTANAGWPASESVGVIWKSCLDQIGVNLTIEVLDSAAYLDKWFSYEYALLYSTGPFPPDPFRIFEIGYTPQVRGSPRYGKVGWQNDHVWDLMMRAATALDEAERQEIYTELQQITVEQVAPVIRLQMNPTLAVATSKVKGFESFNALRLLDWTNMWMEE